jgi:hypothetical protein
MRWNTPECEPNTRAHARTHARTRVQLHAARTAKTAIATPLVPHPDLAAALGPDSHTRPAARGRSAAARQPASSKTEPPAGRGRRECQAPVSSDPPPDPHRAPVPWGLVTQGPPCAPAAPPTGPLLATQGPPDASATFHSPPAPFPPLLTAVAAPEDVEHAVGRRGEAHPVARGGGGADRGERRPGGGGRTEAVERCGRSRLGALRRPDLKFGPRARARWHTRSHASDRQAQPRPACEISESIQQEWDEICV